MIRTVFELENWVDGMHEVGRSITLLFKTVNRALPISLLILVHFHMAEGMI